MAKEKDCCCCTQKCGVITAGVVGLVLVILGGLFVFLFDLIFVAIVENQVVIKEGTELYPEWVAPTPPVYMGLFVFNVTNAAEFLADNSKKPVLEQVGPYVYREFMSKDRIDFLEVDPEQVRYRQTMKIVFEPEMSGGKEDDLITTVNMVAVSVPSIVDYLLTQPAAADITDNQKKIIYRRINTAIADTSSELLITRKASEIFFGYKDPFLTKIIDTLSTLLNTTGNDELLPLPDEFGLFATMNYSSGWKTYQSFTGNPDYKKAAIITTYENMTELPYWFGEECNMINGTDGTMTPAFPNKEDRIYFFVDDICSSMYATFHEEKSIKKVPGWEYRVPAERFKGPINNPENLCFCPNLDIPVCQHDGGIPLTTCLYGAPLFVSAPHFLYGDGYYVDHLVGLDPIEEEHCTPLVYDPSTGACMKADKRIQLSFYLEPHDNVDLLGKFTEPYAFPVLWLNESYTLDDESADSLYSLLVTPAETASILQIILCIVGAALFLFFLGVVIFVYLDKNEETKQNLQEEEKKQKFSSTGFSENIYENGNLDMENEVFKDEVKVKPDSKKHHQNHITSTASTRDLLESEGTPL